MPVNACMSCYSDIGPGYCRECYKELLDIVTALLSPGIEPEEPESMFMDYRSRTLWHFLDGEWHYEGRAKWVNVDDDCIITAEFSGGRTLNDMIGELPFSLGGKVI